jgi:putative transposase
MPRKARIDAPGALHHIICRGIERRKVFSSDADRDDFVWRFGAIIKETRTICYAWALMPNHFHLLLRTGGAPLTTVMQRLMGGYAGAYNRRHRRIGHLFYNRYKSILCQEDSYLLELTRYIHLNPIRADIIKTVGELDGYPYSGHSSLMGRHSYDWQETEKILGMFGSREPNARMAYRAFVQKGVPLGRRPELTGGGLVRSSGGWGVVKAGRKAMEHLRGDERILGDSDFVQATLDAQEEALERRYRLKAQGVDLSKVIDRVAAISGLDAETLKKPGKQPSVVKARSVVCYLAVHELGVTTVMLGKELGICQSAVSKAVARGKAHAESLGIRF